MKASKKSAPPEQLPLLSGISSMVPDGATKSKARRIVHGTLSGYGVHGCRCSLCLKCSRDNQRKWYYDRLDRKDNETLAAYRCLRSCQVSDRARGFSCKLTIEYVKEKIKGGCMYCGRAGMMMTLDRIDNTRGHEDGNVNPSCYRCNILRRDMPYEAWLVMSKTLREMTESGLLGDWLDRPFRRSGYTRNPPKEKKSRKHLP